MTDAATLPTHAEADHAGRAPLVRRIAVAAAVAIAIGLPAWQMGRGIGLSAAEFSAQGDSTLRAAPWAFAIWGVIYAWLIAYGVYALAARRETPRLRILGWPSVLAIAGCGAWILASALNLQWITVAIIVVSALVLIAALVQATRMEGTRREAAFVTWPLGLLAGWLTAASALNILTVLTAQGVIAGNGAVLWALVGIAGVTVFAAGFQRAIRPMTYSLAVAWGLIGVASAEAARGRIIVAAAAGIGAILVVQFLLWPRKR
jgi:hypothetical protein